MTMSATAPGGLCFVQDLINTALEAHAYEHERDRLAEPGPAREWLRGALGRWAIATGTPAPLIALRPDDLGGLQELRERLRTGLRAHALNAPSAPAPASALVVGGDLRLVAADDGRMRYRPIAEDARAVGELVAAETLLAQARGTWPQLKTCANPVCGRCFYDTSPNRSRVWHDTRTCGNTSNLRASRGRRKTS
jgi:predicted RNA-binding Zn ribbon-like protein